MYFFFKLQGTVFLHNHLASIEAPKVSCSKQVSCCLITTLLNHMNSRSSKAEGVWKLLLLSYGVGTVPSWDSTLYPAQKRVPVSAWPVQMAANVFRFLVKSQCFKWCSYCRCNSCEKVNSGLRWARFIVSYPNLLVAVQKMSPEVA